MDLRRRSLVILSITSAIIFILTLGVSWSQEDDYMDSYIGADADYVGSDMCVMCHQNKVPETLLVHVSYFDNNPESEHYGYGCEACHGPGGDHMGNALGIINPAKLVQDDVVELCAQCHDSLRTFTKVGFYQSTHYENNLDCLSCHSGHAENDAFLLNENKLELCYGCHIDKRAEFNMRSHHPVDEGQLVCMTCHNQHSGEYDSQLNADGDALCFGCHADKQGPFMFDHDIQRESAGLGCMTCHFAHGSNNDNLKRFPTRQLCTQCHVDRTPVEHFPGNCYAAGCHSQIHGSNNHPLFFN